MAKRHLAASAEAAGSLTLFTQMLQFLATDEVFRMRKNRYDRHYVNAKRRRFGNNLAHLVGRISVRIRTKRK
jgi:hypothetical protein